MILKFLTKNLTRLIKNPRLAVEILLIGGLLVGGFAYNRVKAKLANEVGSHEELAEGLQEEIRIRNGQTEILKKENGKVVYKNVYVPPEGSIIIQKKDHEALIVKYKELLKKLSIADASDQGEIQNQINDVIGQINSTETNVIIKNKGLCFALGFGYEYVFSLEPRIDAKIAYWNRYGIVTGISSYGLGIGISRQLDDWLWFSPRNISIFMEHKPITFKHDKKWVIGIRSNF